MLESNLNYKMLLKNTKQKECNYLLYTLNKRVFMARRLINALRRIL